MHARVGHVVCRISLAWHRHSRGSCIHRNSCRAFWSSAHPCLSAGFSDGSFFQAPGVLPAFTSSFSSRLLRCLGTGTIVHQPSGRRERCSPSLPNAGQTLEQFLSRSDRPSQASPEIAQSVVPSGMPSSMPSRRKPRERQAVAHLILNLFVGQIVKRLQHPASET